MATNVVIQNGTDAARPNSLIVRGSGGRLFALHSMTMQYSDDNGVTWSADIASGISGSQTVLAIDSSDVIHVAYFSATSKPTYVQFSDLTWGTPQEIDATTASTSRHMDIAIDSTDRPHVLWVYPANNENCAYSKRVAGVWDAKITLFAGFGTGELFPKIVIDSQDRMMAICVDQLIGGTIRAQRYESGAWASLGNINSSSYTINTTFGTTIDNDDNVHFVYQASGVMKYRKYTQSTGLWSVEVTVTTTSVVVQGLTIGVDASDNLHVFWEGGTNGNSICHVANTGTWGSDEILVTDAGNNFSYPNIRTTYWPVIGSVNSMIPTSGYAFNYSGDTGSQFRYYSFPASFPAPQDKNYTRASTAALGGSDANLGNIFDSTGYANVVAQDLVYEDQSSTDDYAVVLFKNKGNSPTDVINVSWVGKVSVAPTTSTVVLQIYNRNSTTWETLDSDNTSSANVPFTLTGTKSTGLSDYYDGSNWVSCRVYQLAQ